MQSKSNLTNQLCQCGCGFATPLATATRRGNIKGTPTRYLRGHGGRFTGPSYSVDSESGCWNWIRVVASNGYGHAYANRRPTGAHRLYYEKYKGPIPRNLQIDHLCRNRRCVNPNHLEAVTARENTRRSPRTKLTEEDIHEIQRLRNVERLAVAVIASRFNISPQHAGDVARIPGKRFRVGGMRDFNYFKWKKTCNCCGINFYGGNRAKRCVACRT